MVKAGVMSGPGEKIVIEEFEEPMVEAGGIVLKTIYSEICGTDVHLHHGRLSDVPYPIIPGHVSVGTIEETGGKLKDIDGNELKKGDLISFYDVHEICNECWFCLVAKATTRCPHRKVYGITYSSNEGLLGGWSELIYLKPGVKIMPLGQDIEPEDFISGGCGLLTSFHAVERSGMKLGDEVVIQGTGPVGLFAIAWARSAGAKKIIAVGSPTHRLEAAGAMGADDIINIEGLDSEERVEEVRKRTHGRGADIVIECSGNPQAVYEGVKMTRDAGNYLIVGQYTDAGDISMNPHYDLNKKHINLFGCWGFDFSHFYKAVKMFTRISNDYPFKNLISKTYSLDEANERLRAVENFEVIKAVIKPN